MQNRVEVHDERWWDPREGIFPTLGLIFSWLLVVAYRFDPANIPVEYITNSNNFSLEVLPLVQSTDQVESWMTY